MNSAPRSSSQAQVLEAYTVLHTLRPGWRGSLILNAGLDARGAAVSLASTVAGAVCLTLEPDAEVLRAALRQGACDFVVNTLDEALRAIKNEIRKGTPLAVGLEGDPGRVLDEIVERGVAPQLVCGLDRFPAQAGILQGWGALRLFGGSGQDSDAAAALLSSAVAERGWVLRAFSFPTTMAVREFDTRALSVLPPEDDLRRRWISSARRLFPRERSRVVWVTPDEAASLDAPAGAASDASIHVP